MPMVARSPSARAHSCSLVYLRSSGYILVPPEVVPAGRLGAGAGSQAQPWRPRQSDRSAGRSGPGGGARLGRLLGAGAAAHDPDPGAVVGDEAVATDDRAALGHRARGGDVEPAGAGLLDDLLALGQGGVVLVAGRRGAEVAGLRGAGGHLVAPGGRPEGEGQRGRGGPAGDVDPVRGVVAEL